MLYFLLLELVGSRGFLANHGRIGFCAERASLQTPALRKGHEDVLYQL